MSPPINPILLGRNVMVNDGQQRDGW